MKHFHIYIDFKKYKKIYIKDILNTNMNKYSEENLNKKTKREIKEARKRILSGKFITQEQAEKILK